MDILQDIDDGMTSTHTGRPGLLDREKRKEDFFLCHHLGYIIIIVITSHKCTKSLYSL